MNSMIPLAGYALWAVPDEPVNRWLSTVIRRLSTYGNTPCFTPHCTIISALNGSETHLMEILKTLSPTIEPFTLIGTSLGFEEYEYRSIVITVKPSIELARLRMKALRVFTPMEKKHFEPHVSLYYGVLPNEEKRELTKSIAKELPMSIPIRHVALWSVQGLPHQWYEVGMVKLGFIPDTQ